MNKVEISKEIREIALKFIESPEMIDYLREDKLSMYDVIEIILYSRASLQDKLISLKPVYAELAEYNAAQIDVPTANERDAWRRESYREDEVKLDKLIKMVEFAVNEITENTPSGTVFILDGNLCGERDSATDNWDCLPYTILEAAIKGITEQTKKYRIFYGDSGDRDSEDINCRSYFIGKWLPCTGGEMKNVVTWLVSDEGVVWFAEINENFNEDLKQLTEDANYDLGWGDHSITRIGIPFKTGDIVTIDNRPTSPICHAVISSSPEDRWKYDCCGIQAIYFNEDGELYQSSLKHDLLGRGFGFPMFSCMYRLSKFTGKLPEEEAVLMVVSEKLKQNPELANDDEFLKRIIHEWKDMQNGHIQPH